jgi:hypothetical protein
MRPQTLTGCFCQLQQVFPNTAFHLLAHYLPREPAPLKLDVKGAVRHVAYEWCCCLFHLFGQAFGSE